MRRLRVGWVVAGLILVPALLSTFKIVALGYSPRVVVPDTIYDVDISMSGVARDDGISMRSFLPSSDERQEVFEERNSSGGLVLSIEQNGPNRTGEWSSDEIRGPVHVKYSYSVRAQAWQWDIDPEVKVGEPPAGFDSFLQSTDAIQVDSPEVGDLYARLVGDETRALPILKSTFDFVADEVTTTDFTGTTDAVTALRLKEASCNGKSRLLVALLRRARIPARLVGGLIMQSGTKRTSHQWVEAYVAGHWISLCPTNDYFAHVPASYLKIYEGDEVLFSHTPDINFAWSFRVKKQLTPSTGLRKVKSHPLNVLDLYDLFARVGVSLNLLKIVLMIPVGALVATFFRNVVGLQTFGTFLPALIAAAARDTGIVWGLIGFTTVILIVALLRGGLEGFRLLHTPKLSAMLAVVVALLITMSLLGAKAGVFDIARLTLFPIAILTLTAERFALVIEERGKMDALLILAQTLIVTATCYAFMSSLFLQTAILTFPELIAVLVGLNLWLGRWMGLRVVELWRFRTLVLGGGA